MLIGEKKVFLVQHEDACPGSQKQLAGLVHVFLSVGRELVLRSQDRLECLFQQLRRKS